MGGMETERREMVETGKVVDLASYRAQQRARKSARHAKPRRGLEALELRQRETIEQLRALGYEMSRPRR